MKALVIGYGSIGQRHARILEEMGQQVFVVSRKGSEKSNFFISVQQAFDTSNFDYIVIANETVAHFDTFQQLVSLNYTGKLLIEKPLFVKSEELIDYNLSKVYVAYNLRFHPLIQQLFESIKGKEVVSVNAYAGQYLPTWRPDSDYSKGYSAYTERGGGVLRDLSHELDYLTLLFGEWSELSSNVGKISNLNIHSEDYVNVTYKTNNGTNIVLELNYLDRLTQRYVIVHTNTETIKIDFIKNTFDENGQQRTFEITERDYTYTKQHEAILKGTTTLCSYEEGLRIVRMIEAIEKSARRKERIYND